MADFRQSPHELFRILAESVRLRILCLVQVRELCVCDPVEILQVPQPTISRHLMILKQAGLVTLRRAKMWSYYSIHSPDDPLWQVASEMIAWSREHSAELKKDAAAMRSKTRPACKE